MNKFYMFVLLLALLFTVTTKFTFSQTSADTTKSSAAVSDTARLTGEIGKIYTKAEADSIYGPVLIADTLKTEDLTKLAQSTPKYMMFNLIEGKAIVLNSTKEVLLNNSSVVSKTQAAQPNQVFRVLSTSKVQELIKQGGSSITTIETRANVLTISNGSTVMEETMPCPPFCP